MGIFDQADWEVRFEWGRRGVEALAPISDVVIVVDVLRFTTTVTAGIEAGAVIYPYPWKDSSVEEFAKTVGAHVAGISDPIDNENYSLSPRSIENIPAGTRLVLPSPNGSALSFAAQRLSGNVLAGCLRNATAVADAAHILGRRISVVAAGERWNQEEDLRPAVEDLVGAGAIVSRLQGKKSPEALAAEAAFHSFEHRLGEFLEQTSSGKELIEKGLDGDVQFASALSASAAVPILREKAFIRWTT